MTLKSLARTWAIPIVIVIVIGMTQTGCANLPGQVQSQTEPAPHVLYLIQSGWHTELLFDGESLLARSEKLRRDFHDNKYLIVGWGDGDYFVTEHPPWTTAVKALVA